MRRILFGLAVLALLLAGVPAIQAAPLEDARRRQRALKAELQAATAELQEAEAALARAEDQLAYDKGQLAAADRQAIGAKAALADQAAAMYRSGGLPSPTPCSTATRPWYPAGSRWPPCW